MRKILLALSLALIFSSCGTNIPQYGQKIGRIVNLSDAGLFWTTLEGELIRGGLVDGTGSMGASFRFTIEDQNLKAIAYKAFSSQSEVKITYQSELITGLWRSSCYHPHFVKNIEIIR